MASSMTGFGKGVASREGYEVTVELKSVNHRFLDLGLRLPRNLLCLEDCLRRVLAERLARGHVDVFVNFKNTAPQSRQVVVDEALAQAYLRAFDAAAENSGMLNDLSLSALLRLPDVMHVEEGEVDAGLLEELAAEAAQAAAAELCAMRAAEGARLAADLTARAHTILGLVAGIEERAPGVVADYRERLAARVAELAQNAPVDEARLATEVAIFADKASITEEIVRLKSHLNALCALLAEQAANGRKLDFLVQEMNREMNTIGSKAADLAIAKLVIDGKAEIEKIREQVQNIE